MVDVQASYKEGRKLNTGNRFQGVYKKVLCVCSAGLLRSPTAALVLSQEPYNYNTRCAGVIPEYALILVDEVLLHWADEIVCMSPSHKVSLMQLCMQYKLKQLPPIYVLDVPDKFEYRDPDLMRIIKDSYNTQVLGNENI